MHRVHLEADSFQNPSMHAEQVALSVALPPAAVLQPSRTAYGERHVPSLNTNPVMQLVHFPSLLITLQPSGNCLQALFFKTYPS